MRLLPPVRMTRSSVFLAVCAIGFSLAAAGAAKEHKIAIDGLKYSPKEIKIKKGDTVVWTNSDDRDHTVTADDGSFASKNMGGGDKFEHKFPKTGKYKYHCDYHPRMKGLVTVEE